MGPAAARARRSTGTVSAQPANPGNATQHPERSRPTSSRSIPAINRVPPSTQATALSRPRTGEGYFVSATSSRSRGRRKGQLAGCPQHRRHLATYRRPLNLLHRKTSRRQGSAETVGHVQLAAEATLTDLGGLAPCWMNHSQLPNRRRPSSPTRPPRRVFLQTGRDLSRCRLGARGGTDCHRSSKRTPSL
jgi:hypothetical protein